ncbi:MAG: glycosyltransferase [Bacteroidales bacterium]
MQNTIAVCILFFEKLELTKKCINSFLPSGVNIYILNNNSSAKSSQKLLKYCTKHHQIKLFHSPFNLGPAGGRNYLINNTEESWLLFVDNDIQIKTINWLQRLEYHINTHPEELIFIPKLYNIHEHEFASFHSFEIKDKVVHESKPLGNKVNCFPGGASIIHRSIFKKYGLYKQELFAFEDYEFAIRCLVKNDPINACLIDDIVLEHRHVYHRRKEDKNAVYERYNSSRLNDAIQTIERTLQVELNHYWEWWVTRQVFLMTENRPLRRIKNILSDLRKQ